MESLARRIYCGDLKTRVIAPFLLLSIIATNNVMADEITSGRSLYLEFCASYHVRNGEGDGPMAPALTVPPTNLRKLSERYGNPLPDDQIARFIDGRADVKAHRPRDMPVWGIRFNFEA